MLRAITNSATALNAQQAKIDTVAANLANINTTGYKNNKIAFTSLTYQQIIKEQNPVRPQARESIFDGTGVRVAFIDKVFDPGALKETGRPLDVAINGPGFFRITLPDGNKAYTREGSFKLNKEGNLVTTNGYLIDPGIKLTENYQQITIYPNGLIEYRDANGVASPAGQIELFNFTAPAALPGREDNLYLYSPAAGEVKSARPGEPGFGFLAQGFLEMSNVDLTAEMKNLIEAQRAYQLSAQAIKTGEEMWGLANSLRK